MKIDTTQAKPPLKLFVQVPEGLKEQLEAHACGECKIVQPTFQQALECHGVRRCDCGEAIKEHYYSDCAGCRAIAEAKKDADELAKAKRVPESMASMLFCRCCEHFFTTSSDLIDEHVSAGRGVPDYAEACEERSLTFDTEDFLEAAMERAEFDPETAEYGAAEVLELDLLLKGWLALHPMVNHFPTGELVDLRCPNCGHSDDHETGCSHIEPGPVAGASNSCDCESREPKVAG